MVSGVTVKGKAKSGSLVGSRGLKWKLDKRAGPRGSVKFVRLGKTVPLQTWIKEGWLVEIKAPLKAFRQAPKVELIDNLVSKKESIQRFFLDLEFSKIDDMVARDLGGMLTGSKFKELPTGIKVAIESGGMLSELENSVRNAIEERKNPDLTSEQRKNIDSNIKVLEEHVKRVERDAVQEAAKLIGMPEIERQKYISERLAKRKAELNLEIVNEGKQILSLSVIPMEKRYNYLTALGQSAAAAFDMFSSKNMSKKECKKFMIGIRERAGENFDIVKQKTRENMDGRGQLEGFSKFEEFILKENIDVKHKKMKREIRELTQEEANLLSQIKKERAEKKLGDLLTKTKEMAEDLGIDVPKKPGKGKSKKVKKKS